MRIRRHFVLLTLLALFFIVAAGLFLTRPMPEEVVRPPAGQATAASMVALDQWQLDVAQQLAAAADTPREQAQARVVLALANQELDLAFAGALRKAATRPEQPSEETQELVQRVADAENSIAAEKAAVDQLTQMLARASGARKEQLGAELELAKALGVLGEERLADAKADLADANGDPSVQIRRMMADHEAAQQRTAAAIADNGAALPPGAASELRRQETAGNTLALFRAWRALRNRETELRQAQQNSLKPLATLSREHNALDRKARTGDTEEPEEAPQAEPLPEAAQPAEGESSLQNAVQEALLGVQRRTDDQRAMADLTKRMDMQQRMSRAYGRWADLVALRQRDTLHRLLWTVLLILLIAVCVFAVGKALNHIFIRLDPQRGGLHSLSGVTRYLIRGAGLLLIFLAFFGPPNQLATVLALMGAGITVVLKDFIVGFFGWFMLQGRDGIRVGDWVEINGVAGEVMEVGLFHTLLLETGNWSDGATRTGRQVKFVNSFAIEGHYFNFTTSGRWLWDELEIVVPAGTDPFPIADQIQQLVTRESEGNMRLAEDDWRRTTGRTQRVFPTTPNVRVRPDPQGAKISVRYLTQATERYALSARIYREMVELLRGKNVFPATAAEPHESPVSS